MNCIYIKSSSDICNDMRDFLDSCGGCAGKMHKIKKDTEAPCLGDSSRYVVLSYELWGTDVRFATPKELALCPCVDVGRNRSNFEAHVKDVRKKLGITEKHELRPAQLEAAKEWKLGKSVFAWGKANGGKTYLAYECALSIKSSHSIYKRMQISQYLTQSSMDNKLIHDKELVFEDASVCAATDNFCRQLDYLLDRMWTDDLKIYMSSNLSPDEFCDKYGKVIDQQGQFKKRFNKFKQVNL